MTRAIAGALVVVAVLLYAGVAAPLGREAGAAADEYRRLRDERREVRVRLARLERRDSVRNALAAGGGPGGAVRAVRRILVDRVGVAGVSDVRLGVRPGRGAVAARLSAQGPFADVLRLCGLLASPDTGLVLTQVHLTPHPPLAGVELDMIAPGSAAP